MKNLNEIIKLARQVNGEMYWLKAIQHQYKLSNSQMGYIVHQLKQDGVLQ